MSNRALLLSGCALTLALAPATPITYAAAPQDVTLSGARVDALDEGRIVASFDASGAIRGLLTLQIGPDAEGVRGEWVLVSRYLDDLDAEGEIDESAQDVHASFAAPELHLLHREYITIRERGTLRGSIAGGTLDFDVDGRLRSIDGLDLRIEGGSLEFAGRSGSASLDASRLHEGNTGEGTLRLTWAPPSAPGVK